jgi:hypothetical protein
MLSEGKKLSEAIGLRILSRAFSEGTDVCSPPALITRLPHISLTLPFSIRLGSTRPEVSGSTGLDDQSQQCKAARELASHPVTSARWPAPRLYTGSPALRTGRLGHSVAGAGRRSAGRYPVAIRFSGCEAIAASRETVSRLDCPESPSLLRTSRWL